MLLDTGRETVTVTPQIKMIDGIGGSKYVDGNPVTVPRVMVQPVTTAELAEMGLQPVTTFRVIGRGPWPGGSRSRVDWRGRTFRQVGEHSVYVSGIATQHVDVIIQAEGAEAK